MATAGGGQARTQPNQGWYPDPKDSRRLRWWDGARWTANVAPRVAPDPGGRAATARRGATTPGRSAGTPSGPVPPAPSGSSSTTPPVLAYDPPAWLVAGGWVLPAPGRPTENKYASFSGSTPDVSAGGSTGRVRGTRAAAGASTPQSPVVRATQKRANDAGLRAARWIVVIVLAVVVLAVLRSVR